MDLKEFLKEWRDSSPTLMVHTSGSTGVPRPMMVEKKRMLSSARLTCDYLGLQAGDTALLCMSLDYIAAKMVVVRAIERHLRIIETAPTGHPLAMLEKSPDFAAMVPMQVYNSLNNEKERAVFWGIKHVIIGGGAIDDELEAALRDHPGKIYSSYGMTETLSHIALRRINGPDADEWYTPLQNVQLDQTGEGCLIIYAPEVNPRRLITNDIIQFAPGSHRFKVIGRKDNVIVSGGIKIHIEDIEKTLYGKLRLPFLISKRPDKKFGEAVVMLTEETDCSYVRHVCEDFLPKYWQPKDYFHIAKIPLTETGKPRRKEAEKIAISKHIFDKGSHNKDRL